MTTEIRLATADDAAGVLAIYAPFCGDSPVSFEVEPPALDEVRRRIAATTARLPWLVGVDAGTVVGFAYAAPHRERAAYRWSVEVTIYIGAGHRRSGVGRALYTALFGALALQGFINAYAGVTLPNPASVGLHEAMGFRPVGIYRHVGYKSGAWHDVGWWQRALCAPTIEPEPPADFAAVLGTAGWAAALAAGAAILRSRGGA